MAATHKGECFCGAVHVEFLRRAGSNGVLPLSIMQILVGWPSQCVYPLASRPLCGSLRVRNMSPCSKKQKSVSGNIARNAVAIS